MGSAAVPRRLLMTDGLTLVLTQIRLEAPDVLSFELCDARRRELPAYGPGAHLDLDLPGGLRRSYSLLDDVGDAACSHYTIAVKREPSSRGASAWLHDVARVGAILHASTPRNDFDLIDSPESALFVAGGIGITPMLPMLAARTRQGRPWVLHYTFQTSESAAFVERLQALEASSVGAGELHLHASRERGTRLDLHRLLRALAPGAHAYCCGPTGLIDAFVRAASARGPETVHVERFQSAQAAADGGFEVELARSGRCIAVPTGSSMLDVLLDAGISMNFSCTQGVCGTCRVGVLAGRPDHRDSCLTQAEREANDVVIACCSGALSPRLVLDL